MRGEVQFALILIAIHWTPLLLAAWRWPFRTFSVSVGSVLKFAVGVMCWLFVLFCLLIFTDVKNRGTAGHGAGWYMIYSVVTLGAVPVIVLTAHIVAGVLPAIGGEGGPATPTLRDRSDS